MLLLKLRNADNGRHLHHDDHLAGSGGQLADAGRRRQVPQDPPERDHSLRRQPLPGRSVLLPADDAVFSQPLPNRTRRLGRHQLVRHPAHDAVRQRRRIAVLHRHDHHQPVTVFT